MDKDYNEIIRNAFYYPQALAVSNQGHNPSIPEDEKVTLRLRPARPEALRPQKSEADWPVSEIDLDSLSASDEILIETARSVYCFTVTDPTVPSGKLIGGILGNRQVSASLVLLRSGGAKRHARGSIRTGSKLIFLIERGHNLRRLTTSTVTGLQRKKEAKTRSVSTCMRSVSLEHLSNDESDR